MAVAPNDVVRIDVIGDFTGTEDLVNSYQFQHTSGTSISDADFLTDWVALLRALYDAIKALWNANVIWRRIRAQNITTGALVGEQSFSSDVVGSGAGTFMAIQNSGLISFKTSIPRVVTRKYFPLHNTQYDATSKVVAGAVTLLNTFGSALLVTQTGVSGHTYRYGFKSPKTGNFELPLSRVVSPTVVTQRRRRPGVGS